MIEIIKSPNQNLKNQPIDDMVLLHSTLEHMDNVLDAMLYFADKLAESGQAHDYTKIQKFPDFKVALESGNIKESDWYKLHISEERHHLMAQLPDDINLIDVLEYISDCMMAGLARSDTLYDITLDNLVLQKAFNNTIAMLRKEVVVKEVK